RRCLTTGDRLVLDGSSHSIIIRENPITIQSGSMWVACPIITYLSISMGIGVVGRACGYNNLCSLENWGPVCRCPWQVNREISELDERPEFSGNSCTHGGPGDDELVEISDVDWPKNDRTYKSEHRARVQRCLSPSCWKKRMPLSNGKLDTGLGSVAFLEVRKGWRAVNFDKLLGSVTIANGGVLPKFIRFCYRRRPAPATICFAGVLGWILFDMFSVLQLWVFIESFSNFSCFCGDVLA
ncbi:histone H2A, partial [Striga asiatica]